MDHQNPCSSLLGVLETITFAFGLDDLTAMRQAIKGGPVSRWLPRTSDVDHSRLSGRQFMQRWSLHILPKGFTRSRCYGGCHGGKRTAYLEQCNQLLCLTNDQITAPAEPTEAPEPESHRKCPHCDSALTLIHSERRPGWRHIFEREIYRQNIYSPQHHIGVGRAPPRAALAPSTESR